MMVDLILRAAARDVINTWGRKENENVRMDLLHNDLNAIPAVDAVPVVHARWVNYKDDHQCSACKEHTIFDTYVWKAIQFEFCPWCGAKMDGERGDENAAD